MLYKKLRTTERKKERTNELIKVEATADILNLNWWIQKIFFHSSSILNVARRRRRRCCCCCFWWFPFSVTRLDDLLHFGQIFKACGNNYFARIDQFLWRCQYLSFLKWNHFLATFIDIWRLFTGHTVPFPSEKNATIETQNSSINNTSWVKQSIG